MNIYESLANNHPLKIDQEIARNYLLGTLLGLLQGRLRKKHLRQFKHRRGVLLKDLIKRDGPACRQCQRTERLTIDHILPLRAGGDNELINLQLLCCKCHLRKDWLWRQRFRQSRLATAGMKRPTKRQIRDFKAALHAQHLSW